MHVPVFTGGRLYPVWPPSEEFSKSALMCYSKGTWTKTDDLKGEFDTFLEAFANFLDKNDCPLVIKDLMIEAKEKYNKKQDKESNQNKQRCTDLAILALALTAAKFGVVNFKASSAPSIDSLYFKRINSFNS